MPGSLPDVAAAQTPMLAASMVLVEGRSAG